MHRPNETFDADEYKSNIMRRISERNFGLDTNNYSKKRNHYTNDSDEYDRRGEITGDFMDTSSLEKGMPLRPKQAQSDYQDINTNSMVNPYLDFNLYDKKPTKKVSYFDPLSTNNTINYSSVSEKNKILPKTKSNNNITTLSNSINMFTFNFLHHFTGNLSQKKSIILSPFSILQTFCLLYMGSKNRTEKELKDHFYLPGKNDTYDALYQINKALIDSKSFQKLNLICTRNDITLNDAYVSYISKIGNFIKYNPNNSQYEVNKLNNLISKSTNGLIKGIISQDMISNKPPMITINTIYFNADWQKPFEKSNTHEAIFKGIQRTKVMMMSQEDEKHNYFEDDYNQIIELDYKNNQFAMGVILPKSEYDEAMVTGEQFDYYIHNLQYKKITILKIPKFRHESRYAIKNLLKKTGLKEVFTNLDISDIVPPMNNQPVFINNVIHVAIIIVDEKGTEAAALTMADMEMRCGPPSKRKEINFIADHQFLYYIRHKPTNTIIFVGQHY